MSIVPPKGKYEWNLNTVVLLVGLGTGLVAWGVTWGKFTNAVERSDQEAISWRAAHEQVHKDRQVALAGAEARVDERLRAAETEIRKFDNLAYRLTVVEQSAFSLSKSIEELKILVNNQSADIRVVREVLAPERKR